MADAATPDPAAEAATRDEAARAARLIGALGPEQRRVIRLAVYGGHSHTSIADALGMPLGTVKTHLRRGLLRVRESLRGSRMAPREEGVQ